MDWKDRLNLPVSAQGEWAVKRFYGDPKLSAAYLPVAYFLLGELTSRMAKGNVSYGHRRLELPDGTKIRVIRDGERNIIEITTTSFEKSFVTSSGSGGFIFYPKTETKPLGIYPPETRAVYYPLPKETPPWLPFATLTYQYKKEDKKFDLSAQAPRGVQAGNQFFLGADGSTYSWWHSSCGDGPVISQLYPEFVLSQYTTFFLGGTLYYKDANKQLRACLPVIYKDGAVWVTLNTAWKIVGFWGGQVEVKPEVFETRYVVALYAAIKLSFLVFTLNGTEMTVIPTNPEEFRWENQWVRNSSSWPVRFNNLGNEASVILAGSDDPTKYVKGEFSHLKVCTISILHTVDSVSLSKTETIHSLGNKITTQTKRQFKKTNVFYYYYYSTFFIKYFTADWDYTIKDEVQFSEPDCEIPIALNYDNNGVLHFVYATVNHMSREWGIYAKGNREDILNYYRYDPNKPIGNRVDFSMDSPRINTYRRTSTAFNTDFINLKSESSILYSFETNPIHTDVEIVYEQQYEQRIDGASGMGSSRNIEEITAQVPDPTKTKNTQVRILYVGAVSQEIVTAEFTRTVGGKSGSLRQFSEWFSTSNPYSAEATNTINAFVVSIDNVGVAVNVANSQNTKELLQTFKEYRNTQTFTEPELSGSYPTYNELLLLTGVPAYVLSGPISAGDEPGVPYIYTDTTLDLVNPVFSLFDLSIPVNHSYVKDARAKEVSVWARSLQVYATVSVADHPDLIVNESQTDSTFGPLHKHIFMLDSNGNIKTTPIDDETLTVHPIGLY